MSLFIKPDFGFAQQSTFVSNVDQNLTVSKVLIAPFTDNVGGIYAAPLTGAVETHFKETQQYDFDKITGPVKSMELLSNAERLKILTTAKAQAVVTGHLSKGPMGIAISISMYGGSDGQILSMVEKKNIQLFDHKNLILETQVLMKQLMNQLPFHGVVLSRKTNLVTINIGKWADVAEGTELNVILLLKLQRHPKFGFIIGAEREILGRLKIQKVEDYLSFATIDFEKESNLIKPGMKVVISKMVKYQPTLLTKDGKVIDQINQQPDAPVAYGKNPEEWTPARPPAFGKMGFLAGFGSYNLSNTTSSGAVEKENQLNPSLWIGGEMWVTTKWFINFDLRQTVVSVPNGLADSTPEKLNLSSTYYSLVGSYNFLLEDDFWGPKVYLGGGYSKFDTKIDDSNPTAYTSLSWGGLIARIGGALPVEEWTVGAQLDFFVTKAVSESPVSSGDSVSGNMTTFEVYGIKKIDTNLQWKGALNYSLYSASFSGTGSRTPSASSASHKLTTFVLGIEYLF